MPSFEQFTSTPDDDGDMMIVRQAGADTFAVKVQDADGDFRMVYVSTEEMVTLAHAVLAAQESACTCYRSDGVHYSSCPMWDEATNA